jgi:biopolymer transport protein ExbD
MSTVDAAAVRSTDPSQPLLIPPLYSALRQAADSIRSTQKVAAAQPLDTPLAIQGDKSMRYDLLARMMQTARLAGFKNLSLQVNKVEDRPPAGAK